MIHTVIVPDSNIFKLIIEQTGAKKVPLTDLSYEVFAHGTIRIVGAYSQSSQEILASVVSEFAPDTVFFLSESLPVSDEKLAGDIILPNVFFLQNPEIETMELDRDSADSLL